MTQLTIDSFRDAFRARRAYCAALLELSERQAAFIVADDYNGLLDLLSHKQQLIDSWTSQHTDQRRVWSSWAQVKGSLPAEIRAGCEAVLADCQTLTSRLLEIESESTQSLKGRHDDTRIMLATLVSGQQANGAYADLIDHSPSRRLNVNL